MNAFRGYVGIIHLQSADNLIVHSTDAGRVIVSSMKSMEQSSQQAESTTIDFAQSFIWRTGKSRIGETTWTPTPHGMHCRHPLTEADRNEK